MLTETPPPVRNIQNEEFYPNAESESFSPLEDSRQTKTTALQAREQTSKNKPQALQEGARQIDQALRRTEGAWARFSL